MFPRSGLESAACFDHPVRRAGAAEPIGRTVPLCERSGATAAHGSLVPEQSRDATRPLARRPFCPKPNVPSAPCSHIGALWDIRRFSWTRKSMRKVLPSKCQCLSNDVSQNRKLLSVTCNHQVAIESSSLVTASRRRSSCANCESESSRAPMTTMRSPRRANPTSMSPQSPRFVKAKAFRPRR